MASKSEIRNVLDTASGALVGVDGTAEQMLMDAESVLSDALKWVREQMAESIMGDTERAERYVEIASFPENIPSYAVPGSTVYRPGGKIAFIKTLRTHTNLGLRAAKDFSESLPRKVYDTRFTSERWALFLADLDAQSIVFTQGIVEPEAAA